MHTNTQTQYKQTCSCTQMFALCGNRTRDLLRSRQYSHHYATSAVNNNMTYIQNAHRFRGYKLTFTDWLEFSLTEKLTYEIHFF
jgi:hypothetical protein